jgi:hypothetical protein
MRIANTYQPKGASSPLLTSLWYPSNQPRDLEQTHHHLARPRQGREGAEAEKRGVHGLRIN